MAALREQTGLIVQLSTGGSVHDPLENRLPCSTAAPDSCSLTCGTVNFGDDVFLNPWPFMVELYERAREAQVVPEFELFDLGQVAALRRLLEHGLPYGGKVHCDFVHGRAGRDARHGGRPGRGGAGAPAEVTSWSATGIGRGHLPVRRPRCRWAVTCGSDGGQPVYARGQAGALQRRAGERAAGLADQLQRPPMSTAPRLGPCLDLLSVVSAGQRPFSGNTLVSCDSLHGLVGLRGLANAN